MRKVGPSLRDTAGKLDAAFLWSWLKDPASVSPQTMMPRFFGLHDHLEGEELKDAQRLEAVEIRAVAEYLLSVSQPVEPLRPPGEVTEPPSAARGGELFVRRGCVACHRHEEVWEGESVFGPDLSNLGSKLTTEASHRWLRSWIRDPARHSPRTRMPNTLLEPVPLENDESQPARMTDPAADIAAFLLESSGREPEPVPTSTLAQSALGEPPLGGPPLEGPPLEGPALDELALDELALEHLGKSFSQQVARRYLTDGIPESQADRIEGDLIELLEPMTQAKKVRYVGRRTIRKLGCFGCHDVPGFEDAQPIAPALTDWGRKQESLLGFEQVHRFVLDQGPLPAEDSDRSFYLDALVGKRREGFLWQKLHAPRSFDYEKTQNKPYNERLAMGRFSFGDAQREAIVTFVLGLIGQPPAEKYVYQPDRREAAIIEGRKVIEKYGCAECHTMRMDEWTFRYDPEWFEDFVGGPASAESFDFVKPHFSPEELNASLVTDARGWEQAKVVGTPYVDPSGEPIEDEDDDGNPILVFNLWEPAVIHGEVWRVGGMQVPIQEPNITRKRPAWGGAFARLLYPRLAEEAGASWVEAWGWVPPPLAHEGRLVRPDWLYNYLLEPVPIRPSVVLRMPKYNLSPEEAGTLANYFAALSGTDFPYAPHSGLPSGQSVDPARLERLENALGLVIDRTTFCAKCHLIGDLDPGGQSGTILAPRLDRVGRRIRPEYLRRWLADPKSVLPYTGMPVNFPPTGDPFGQDLYQGRSLEQIDAVIDLLLNYDWFMNQRTSIRALIEKGDRGEGTPAEPTAP